MSTYLIKISYTLTKNGCRFDNQQLYVGLFNRQTKSMFELSKIDFKTMISKNVILNKSDIINDVRHELIDITGHVDDLYIVDFWTRIFVGNDYERNMSQALISTCDYTADQKMVCCVDEDGNTTTSLKNIIKSDILQAGKKDNETFTEIFGGDDYIIPLREYFYS